MPQARPNVLLIMVDEWPGYLMGAAGHPVVETPTLDAMSRAGVRFTRAYTETPLCVPARRTLMTGTDPRTHGDRYGQGTLAMPDLPTLAGTFRQAGYQANAIGKLHVYPQRDRIGFDEVMLAEEGRQLDGCVDDYEIFLGDNGHAGRHFMHGMGNNEYGWRTWHLEERLHVTNWITGTAARSIKRRDPTRPGLWYVSYTAPHPPIVPLASYFERYARRDVDPPVHGGWSGPDRPQAAALDHVRSYWPDLPESQLEDMRRAYYAMCTHVDHQIRILIGTLREEGLLDNTIIAFSSDHGDMLGDHGLYAKKLMYEGSANIPMILMGLPSDVRIGHGTTDDRLCGLQDVMPTLLQLCDIAVPASCTGRSIVTDARRHEFYAECGEGVGATRMLHDGRYKLIWYPAGNRVQLFDLENDPREVHDLGDDPAHAQRLAAMAARLIDHLYGCDLDHVRDGALVGFDPGPAVLRPNRGLSGQRGLQYPPATARPAAQAAKTL